MLYPVPIRRNRTENLWCQSIPEMHQAFSIPKCNHKIKLTISIKQQHQSHYCGRTMLAMLATVLYGEDCVCAGLLSCFGDFKASFGLSPSTARSLLSSNVIVGKSNCFSTSRLRSNHRPSSIIDHTRPVADARHAQCQVQCQAAPSTQCLWLSQNNEK